MTRSSGGVADSHQIIGSTYGYPPVYQLGRVVWMFSKKTATTTDEDQSVVKGVYECFGFWVVGAL